MLVVLKTLHNNALYWLMQIHNLGVISQNTRKLSMSCVFSYFAYQCHARMSQLNWTVNRASHYIRCTTKECVKYGRMFVAIGGSWNAIQVGKEHTFDLTDDVGSRERGNGTVGSEKTITGSRLCVMLCKVIFIWESNM